jgi:hypothetical protein
MNLIRQGRLIAALGVLLVGLVACATPGPVLTENVGTIRTGISTAREQSRLAFEGANRVARSQAIDLKVEDTKAVSIGETDFPLAVSQADIDHWAEAFDVLDAYAAALQKLVDPALAQGTGDALQALGDQLQNGKVINAKLPSGIAGTFASFGQALVQARAEKKAIDIMRRTSPQFSAVMSGMADAIGSDNTSDLRATVHGSWQEVLGHARTNFGQTSPANREARRQAIQQFVDAMDARDAQDANLGQLRASLIALGEAHAAAARGSHGEALFWIERISSWLDDVRHRTEELQKAHADAANSGNETGKVAAGKPQEKQK